jgi:hypothetical protein
MMTAPDQFRSDHTPNRIVDEDDAFLIDLCKTFLHGMETGLAALHDLHPGTGQKPVDMICAGIHVRPGQDQDQPCTGQSLPECIQRMDEDRHIMDRQELFGQFGPHPRPASPSYDHGICLHPAIFAKFIDKLPHASVDPVIGPAPACLLQREGKEDE